MPRIRAWIFSSAIPSFVPAKWSLSDSNYDEYIPVIGIILNPIFRFLTSTFESSKLSLKGYGLGIETARTFLQPKASRARQQVTAESIITYIRLARKKHLTKNKTI